MYKRLTKRDELGNEQYATHPKADYIGELYEETKKKDREILYRLAELEDKIENGTLIELPCKVGDDFWYITMIWDISGKFIGEMYKAKVEGFYVPNEFIQIEDDEIFHYHAYGEEAFLTKAEAEQKLKELENERD